MATSTATKGKSKVAQPREVQRIHWVFRCNADQNLPVTHEDRFDEVHDLINDLIERVEAFAFQLESAPTTGYLHYQGYFQLINRDRKRHLLDTMRAFEYLSPCKGSPKQAWCYAVKEDTRMLGPWTVGSVTALEAKEKMVDFVESCKTMDDLQLWEKFPSCMVRYHNTPGRIRALQPPIPPKKLEVYVFYGPPGTGKSYMARALFPNIYVVPYSKELWFTEGYAWCTAALLEDFSGECPLKRFNRIIDSYSEAQPIKGNFIVPKNIEIWIITTNVLPHCWYQPDGRQDIVGQVLRRITACYDFTNYSVDQWETSRNIPPSLSPQQLYDLYGESTGRFYEATRRLYYGPKYPSRAHYSPYDPPSNWSDLFYPGPKI